ncbi:hypothetical protein V7x_15810 [Crateriforma conspicua]|uniref:Uncharacterized protein n=1 Tax=Crateriforma conspicua TaxID=2527996 RepID=A0A5C6FUR3_9PLAN|nr:hypothetical protein V7x_15810 [Crateriforma conspicua]
MVRGIDNASDGLAGKSQVYKSPNAGARQSIQRTWCVPVCVSRASSEKDDWPVNERFLVRRYGYD